jgi:hypothetical protein
VRDFFLFFLMVILFLISSRYTSAGSATLVEGPTDAHLAYFNLQQSLTLDLQCGISDSIAACTAADDDRGALNHLRHHACAAMTRARRRRSRICFIYVIK